jgi:hypothetical protein
VYDTFERQLWERGTYFLYRNDTRGAAFQVFDTELAEGAPGRVLHVRADLPAQTDGAWWGYGLNWSLEESPFAALTGFFSNSGARTSPGGCTISPNTAAAAPP